MQRWMDRVNREPGVMGLYLFALTLHANRALAVLGCLMMLFGLYRLTPDSRAALARLPLYRWLLLFAIYVLLRALAAMLADPGAARTQGSDAVRFVYFVGVLPVAWFLEGSERRLLRVLALALAGFLIARLWHLPAALALPAEAWAIERPGLGLAPIGLGYYAGFAFIGMLLLSPGILASIRGTALRATAAGSMVAAALFLLQCVIWSQSRGAWLSLLPCLLLALGWFFYRNRTGRWIALLVLTTLIGVGMYNRDTIGERFGAEQATLQLLMQGKFDEIRSGDERGGNYSIGTRINMFRAGLDALAEHPLIGAGPAAPRLLLKAHPDPILRQWNDFHNAPVDLAVRFGAIGLLLLAGGVLATAACGLGSDFRRAYGGDLQLLLWIGFALLILSSLSNFRLLNFDWRYWLFLVTGAMASPRLAALRRGNGHSS